MIEKSFHLNLTEGLLEGWESNMECSVKNSREKNCVNMDTDLNMESENHLMK
jgi:hypothetical protein